MFQANAIPFDVTVDEAPARILTTPRYAETGQSEIAPGRTLDGITRRSGRFTRTQNGVQLLNRGFLEDAVDPRTDPGMATAIAPSDSSEPDLELVALDPPESIALAELRVDMLTPYLGRDLALVLQAADALGVGRTPDPRSMPAFDLAEWVDRRASARLALAS